MLGFPEHIIMASVFRPLQKEQNVPGTQRLYGAYRAPPPRRGYTNKVSHSIQRK